MLVSCLDMKNRIKELREAQGLSQQELAEAAGTSNQQIGRLEKSTRRLTVDWMERLAPPLQVAPQELMSITTSQHRIRLIGEVRAGDWIPPDEKEAHDGEYFNVPLPEIYAKLRPYALRVSGPSMNLIYPQGTILICCHLEDLHEDARPGKFYIIEDVDEHGGIEATVKEFQLDKDGKRWAWPRSNDPRWQAPVALDEGRDGHTIELKARVVFSMKPE